MTDLYSVIRKHQAQKRRLQEEAGPRGGPATPERNITMVTTTTEPFAAQKNAGTWFDGFLIGTDNAEAAAELRAAVRKLYDGFEADNNVNDPTDDAEKAAFMFRTVVAIVAEEVYRRAEKRVNDEFRI